MGTDGAAGGGAAGTQRIDKWLWYARFFKTRSLAADMVQAGKVRVTAEGREPARITKPAHAVRPGDVLTFPQGAAVRVVKVLAPGTRRGPAPEAQDLFEDLAPSPPRGAQGAATQQTPEPLGGPVRDAGAGRPTKRDRRALDRLKRGD